MRKIIENAQHDDGNLGVNRVIFEPFQNLEAIQVGHVQIQKKNLRQRIFVPVEIRPVAFQIGQGVLAVLDDMNRICDFGQLESVLQKRDVMLEIFRY